MRKSAITAALCALYTIGIAAGPTMSQAATITIFHGSKAEAFDMDKTPPDGVHVVRPIFTQPPVAASRATRPYVANATFAAGDTLWTRNARTGALVACAFGSSGMVGKYVIRCTGPDAFGR